MGLLIACIGQMSRGFDGIADSWDVCDGVQDRNYGRSKEFGLNFCNNGLSLMGKTSP